MAHPLESSFESNLAKVLYAWDANDMPNPLM
jgi:hypothetical protein